MLHSYLKAYAPITVLQYNTVYVVKTIILNKLKCLPCNSVKRPHNTPCQ